MTEQQAMRMALEALEQYHSYMEPLTTVFGGPRVPAEQSTTGKVEKAITALRQALEQQKDEPVAWCDLENWSTDAVWPDDVFSMVEHKGWTPLYTRPQPAAWVGLDRKEMLTIIDQEQADTSTGLPMFYRDQCMIIARTIETALRSKNT